jgi:hypothetical protein
MTGQILMFGAPPGDPRDSWETPWSVFNDLNRVFGFKVDLAASDSNHRLPEYHTRERSALDVDWRELPQPLWCNPPFSDLGIWTEYAAEYSAGSRAEVAVLMPANRTDLAGIEASSCSFGSLLALYGFSNDVVSRAAHYLRGSWTLADKLSIINVDTHNQQ